MPMARYTFGRLCLSRGRYADRQSKSKRCKSTTVAVSRGRSGDCVASQEDLRVDIEVGGGGCQEDADCAVRSLSPLRAAERRGPVAGPTGAARENIAILHRASTLPDVTRRHSAQQATGNGDLDGPDYDR